MIIVQLRATMIWCVVYSLIAPKPSQGGLSGLVDLFSEFPISFLDLLGESQIRPVTSRHQSSDHP